MTPRALREKLGMTQEVFAIEVGVSISTVQKWELGTKPSPMAQEKIERFKRKHKLEAA